MKYHIATVWLPPAVGSGRESEELKTELMGWGKKSLIIETIKNTIILTTLTNNPKITIKIIIVMNKTERKINPKKNK